MEIKETELKEIVGGGFSFSVAAWIGAGIAFLIGVFDGYMRPYACR